MSNCKYCDVDIPEGCIRCIYCNSAWLDGNTAGYEELQSKLSQTFRTLVRLIGIQK